MSEIRAVIPAHVSIGVSGEAAAAAGLTAGCDAWYSVIADTLPAPALRITRAAQEWRLEEVLAESGLLVLLWQLFVQLGRLRVVAAMAEQLEMAPRGCLPLPLQGLDEEQRTRVARIVDDLGLGR